MTVQNACGNTQPQFLTRETLFDSRASRIHVFDGISHGTALEILRETMPEYQWAEYFGLPVMPVNDVAAYYGLKAKKIKSVIGFDNSCLGELIQGGLLVLREQALEEALSQFDTPPQSKELILLPPQAALRLCLVLPVAPAVAATFNTFWDYVVSKGLDESTLADWESTVYRYCAIHCDRIGEDRELAKRLIEESKNLNLYPYVQHFGQQDCLETWFGLLAYKREFPPPRGKFYIKKHTWLDRISDVCLRE